MINPYTIVFEDMSDFLKDVSRQPTVWVCNSLEAYNAAMSEVKSDVRLRIIQAGQSPLYENRKASDPNQVLLDLLPKIQNETSFKASVAVAQKGRQHLQILLLRDCLSLNQTAVRRHGF